MGSLFPLLSRSRTERVSEVSQAETWTLSERLPTLPEQIRTEVAGAKEGNGNNDLLIIALLSAL